MPAAKGLKRSASKASGAAPPKIKKKHGVQLEVPSVNKIKGRLLACGQGDVGQLGLGEDVMETTRFKFVSSLGDKIVDACAGGMHTVALDSNGKVWTFGCNDEGALGRSTSGEGAEFSAATVALPQKAVAISAGDSHTAALLENGDVYLWGAFRDSHGSMGLVCEGREGKACREPVRLGLREPAAAIASGGDHHIVLTTSGAVYSLGCGEQGQLGRLSQRSASRHARQGLGALLIPTAITLKSGAKQVWAGSHATLAVDSNAERMLVWGLNNYGQLGVTGTKKKVALYAPVEADAFTAVGAEAWTHVACGQHHSLAIDQVGQCYAVGRCDYGRLGLGEGSGDADNLTPVPKLLAKKCISVGAATSSSFAVTDTGEVYAWGMGSEGQLGTGSEDDQQEPRLVTGQALEGRRAIKVSAGGQHTILLVASTDDGTEADSSSTSIATESQKVEDKVKPAKDAQDLAEDDQISSTSAQEAMEVDAKPAPQKKVNGEPTQPTPMETDDSSKPEEKPTVEETTQQKPEPTITTKAEVKTDAPSIDAKSDEPKPAEAEKAPEPEKPNIDSKPVETDDVDMPEQPAKSEVDVKTAAANKSESEKAEVVDKIEVKEATEVLDKKETEEEKAKPEIDDKVESQAEPAVNGNGDSEMTESTVTKAVVTEKSAEVTNSVQGDLNVKSSA